MICVARPQVLFYNFLFLVSIFDLNASMFSLFCVLSECVSRARNGKICIASFDWNCTGVCNSVERMEEIHQHCGETNLKQIWMMSYDNKTKESQGESRYVM
jgi:hypothetical protein